MVLMSQRAVYILLVLISALFYTLFERKLLGASHLRLGPTLVRVYGALQPLADVLKLFLKGQVGKEGSYWLVYTVRPSLALILVLCLLRIMS